MEIERLSGGLVLGSWSVRGGGLVGQGFVGGLKNGLIGSS